MFGPIDDGSRLPEQAPVEEQPPKLEDTKVYQRVRRSSRFFRAGGGARLSASSECEESVGSVFTQVAVEAKKDRRKSRRTNFVVFQQPPAAAEPDQENSGRSSGGSGKSVLPHDPPQHRPPLSPIENLAT